MTRTSLAKSAYSQALKEISDLYLNASKTLAQTYWQIGKHIVLIEQDGNVRAEYGTHLLEKFSSDLTARLGKGFSRPNLNRMRQFYLNHPKSSTSNKLSWSQTVELLPVGDERKRKELERKSVKNKLSARAIREAAQKASGSRNRRKTDISSPPKPLTRPKNLELNTFTKVQLPELPASKGKILIDCGFFVLREVSPKTATVKKSAYTYSAKLERVVDGDTLKVLIDLGFDTIANVRLRLRGINCPELGTPEGKKAKQFVQKLLKPGQTIVVKTHKTDFYGRFVADVFYSTDSNNADNIISEGIYLNNLLFEKGLAEIML